jgi:hypothetical protein
MLAHIDPHIPFIPAFLLNFVLGVLAPYVFNQVRRAAKMAEARGSWGFAAGEQVPASRHEGAVSRHCNSWWSLLSSAAYVPCTSSFVGTVGQRTRWGNSL